MKIESSRLHEKVIVKLVLINYKTRVQVKNTSMSKSGKTGREITVGLWGVALEEKLHDLNLVEKGFCWAMAKIWGVSQGVYQKAWRAALLDGFPRSRRRPGEPLC